MTWAIGDSEEMRRAMDMLAEVKEGIINAYQLKSNQGRTKLSNLMDAETWLSAHKAIELGFADGVLEDAKQVKPATDKAEVYAFSRKAVTNSLLDKLLLKNAKQPAMSPVPSVPCASCTPPASVPPETPQGITAESLSKRLSLIPH